MSGSLLPDWAECLFDDKLRYVALYGGRGGAKSWSIADALLIRAFRRQKRILCARETQKSIRDSVKRLLDDAIDRAGFSEFYRSTDTEIRGANGSLFIFSGIQHCIDSIRSMEGIDICWLAEAQRASANSLEILIPTIRAKGSQIIFDWNPREPDDPVDDMFRGPAGPPPRSHVQQVNYDENPWFPGVLREEMEYDLRRDPDKYQHIWLGGYRRNSESRVFKNWIVDEFETPADAIHRLGADWGFAADPTVLIRCHIVGRTLFVDHEAYRVGCEIMDTPDLFMTVPEAERWPMTADSARPETISHMRKHGFPKICRAVKGPKSIEDGIEWLKTFNIVVHSRCRHTIDELSSYSFKVDKKTGEVLPVLGDKDNHVIDALRYACEGIRRAQSSKPKVPTLTPTVSRFH